MWLSRSTLRQNSLKSHNLIDASAPAVTSALPPKGECILMTRHTPRPLWPRSTAIGSSRYISAGWPTHPSSLLCWCFSPFKNPGGETHNLTVQSSPAVTKIVDVSMVTMWQSHTRPIWPRKERLPPKDCMPLPGKTTGEVRMRLAGTIQTRAVRSSDVEKTLAPSCAQQTLIILPLCPFNTAHGSGRLLSKIPSSPARQSLASRGVHSWIWLNIVPAATSRSLIEAPRNARE